MDAKRLGCLFIPEFRIQVHQRDEGLERHAPVALLRRQARRLTLSAVNTEAEAAGLYPGMNLAQAEVACPQLIPREEDPPRYLAAGKSLLERLSLLVPLLEAERLGLYYLGMKGLRWLYRDEAGLLRTVLEEATRQGFEASAGAATTRFTAFTAARLARSGQLRQIFTGEEKSFLAPLPLALLQPPDELLERLSLLGISTLGELAALPSRSVERRYGKEGLELYRLARGEDTAWLNPTLLPSAHQRVALLENPVDQAEGLLFVLAPLVESLLEELLREGRACLSLNLTLRLEGREELEVPLLLRTAVTQARPVLDLLRLKLGRLQLPAGVIEARLEAGRITEPSTPQGDLFKRVGSPSGMALTLARLTEALGPAAVLTGQLVDGYRPDQTFTARPAQEHGNGLLAAAGGGEAAPARKRRPSARSSQKAASSRPLTATSPAEDTSASVTQKEPGQSPEISCREERLAVPRAQPMASPMEAGPLEMKAADPLSSPTRPDRSGSAEAVGETSFEALASQLEATVPDAALERPDNPAGSPVSNLGAAGETDHSLLAASDDHGATEAIQPTAEHGEIASHASEMTLEDHLPQTARQLVQGAVHPGMSAGQARNPQDTAIEGNPDPFAADAALSAGQESGVEPDLTDIVFRGVSSEPPESKKETSTPLRPEYCREGALQAAQPQTWQDRTSSIAGLFSPQPPPAQTGTGEQSRGPEGIPAAPPPRPRFPQPAPLTARVANATAPAPAAVPSAAPVPTEPVATPPPPEERLSSSFRRLSPPRRLDVSLGDDGPQALRLGGRRRQVTRRQGPFRYGGSWWGSPYDREYYQLTLADGVEVLIFCDLQSGSWYLEGAYD